MVKNNISKSFELKQGNYILNAVYWVSSELGLKCDVDMSLQTSSVDVFWGTNSTYEQILNYCSQSLNGWGYRINGNTLEFKSNLITYHPPTTNVKNSYTSSPIPNVFSVKNNSNDYSELIVFLEQQKIDQFKAIDLIKWHLNM